MAVAVTGIMLLVLLLSCVSSSIFALYEDQAGLVDWHQQYVGMVKNAVFHTQKTGRKRVVISTEENAIASLDLRRGEIFWRHLLGESDIIDELDITLGKYLITVSSRGRAVRAWNLPDGQLVWESYLQGSLSSKPVLLIPSGIKPEKEATILVFDGVCLYSISSLDGAVAWQREFPISSLDVQQLFQAAESDIIYVMGFVDSSEFHTFQIDFRNGNIIRHRSATFRGGFSGKASLVSPVKLIAMDATSTAFVIISLQDNLVSFHQAFVSDLLANFSGSASIMPLKLCGMFGLRTKLGIALIRVKNIKDLEIIEKINESAVLSDSISYTEGLQAVALVQQEGNSINLRVKNLGDASGHYLLRDTIKIDHQKGVVENVFINNYMRTDRSHGFRALITMEDHSLLLVQQSEIVWSREDGLASVVAVTTSELPLQKEGVVSTVEHNLLDWLNGHVLKLKSTLMLASPEDISALQEMRLKNSQKNKMTRDHNGFRKLLIVLTKAGKVLALHTGDGRVIWSVLLPLLWKSKGCEHPTALYIYHWRVPHHHALDVNPSVVVVGKCGCHSDAPCVLSFIDSYTGEEIESMRLTHSVALVLPLPFTDSAEQRLHLIVDSEKRAHLYPRSVDSLKAFHNELSNIYWYLVDNGMIKGHALSSSCNPDITDEYCFGSRELWSIVFPSENEKIVTVSTRQLNEVVHTQVKVIAEHDVLYRYVSRNLLFVATVAPKAAEGIGYGSLEETWLVVYLIDTITGRVLHRVTHPGSQGPVHAICSENWIVYHYFNNKAYRYQMSVIEIYDQSRTDNKDVWKLVLGKHNLTAPISSYSQPDVILKSQTYFFAHSVRTMAVSSTAKGITSRQLLVGTVGDQILALDKRYFDPRRTSNPSQTEKEEGIIPLTDSIPIISQSYITHSLQVEGLRGIVAVPAKLESTSLVFAYGVDLFFTRIAPSRTFDSLTEDFSYALLLITIIALLAAIVATWIMAEKKDLQRRWQ